MFGSALALSKGRAGCRIRGAAETVRPNGCRVTLSYEAELSLLFLFLFSSTRLETLPHVMSLNIRVPKEQRERASLARVV
ncbi:hypothetical protein BJY01DRAFT_225853 [Aspergillus pseudoustus]|uniref:Uncharacterized protein n=1 Tax=Aspergillus pseudoustus TaxID=1810923 RepID=A0ABR4IYN2_9EURO